MNRRIAQALVVALCSLLAREAAADGLIRDGVGAIPIGRGGTNIAFADNGAVLLDNPAGMVNCVVTGNTSLTGGGVFNDHSGNLTIVTSQLTHNSATYTGLLGGGAIVAGDHSLLTMLGSEVSNNTADGVGGGIQIFESARADIRTSGVDDNSSDGNDGGIAVGDVGFTPGFLTLVNSHVEPAPFRLSAQCNRVMTLDGHLEAVSIEFARKPSLMRAQLRIR